MLLTQQLLQIERGLQIMLQSRRLLQPTEGILLVSRFLGMGQCTLETPQVYLKTVSIVDQCVMWATNMGLDRKTTTDDGPIDASMEAL